MTFLRTYQICSLMHCMGKLHNSPSTLSNIFSTEAHMLIQAKFLEEPPFIRGLKVRTNAFRHRSDIADMSIFGK